jgi:hypothetical protein
VFVLDDVDLLADSSGALERIILTFVGNDGFGLFHLDETITCQVQPGGSVSAYKPWRYAEDIWIQETVLNVIVGEVLVVEADIDVESFWSRILGNLANDCSRVGHLAVNVNLVAHAVHESDLDSAAVVVGTLEVLSADLDLVAFGVLGHTVSRVYRGHFGTVVELDAVGDVLPLLLVRGNLNSDVADHFSFGSNTFLLSFGDSRHVDWLIDDGASYWVDESALKLDCLIGAVVVLELVEVQADHSQWRVAGVGEILGVHVFDDEGLVVLESVFSVTVVESLVRNELLTISRYGNHHCVRDIHRWRLNS